MLAKIEEGHLFRVEPRRERGRNKEQRSFPFSSRIPKIANKEIPVHNFGNTLANLSLLKNKNAGSKVWSFSHRDQEKSSLLCKKSQYDRPVHLLKEYLVRK